MENAILSEIADNNLCKYEIITNNNLQLTFTLTDQEQQCFKTILTIINKNNLQTTCRVAGGWVRDKILGRHSQDIDIALDNMKGEVLGSLINSELYPGKQKLGIVQQNLNKGKNLETATIKVEGIFVDFVNLRSENPDKIGSPTEDAMRRDLTINSLFYNVNEGKVEDFSGRGIEDLRNGLVRTPLKPQVTFYDDPLRIMRMLRFALKYRFKVSDEIIAEVYSNKQYYKEYYMDKVSNERIEKELFSIMIYDNCEFAINFLYHMDMLPSVFKINYIKTKDSFDEDIYSKINNFFIIGQYILRQKLFIEDDLTFNDTFKIDYGLFLLTYFFSFYKGNKNLGVNSLILRDSLKTSNDFIKTNGILCKVFEKFRTTIHGKKYDRLDIGLLLREIEYKNLHKLLYAGIAYDYLTQYSSNKIIHSINDEQLNNITTTYTDFYSYIKEQNLLHTDQLKPLLNGKEIIEHFKMKPGKQISFLLSQLLNQQIKDPSLTKAQAVNFLKTLNDASKN